MRGKSGPVTVNGADYDPAAGMLFLVSTGSGRIRVRQLNCDLSGLKPDDLSFANFAKSDPDIAEFVAEASKAATHRP